jgi:hypothetical protein
MDIYDGTPILTIKSALKTTKILNSALSAQQMQMMRSLDSINARILTSMVLANIGIFSYAAVSDIKAGYEAYNEQIAVGHLGEEVEQRLNCLSEQRLLSRAGSKSKV